LGAGARQTFLADLAEGAFAIEYGEQEDIVRAGIIARKHRALKLGLVDAVVIAIAERVKAEAIATLDVRHFGAVKIAGSPRLWPRDAK
jgi:predicted nucleic acid-binding protein